MFFTKWLVNFLRLIVLLSDQIIYIIIKINQLISRENKNIEIDYCIVKTDLLGDLFVLLKVLKDYRIYEDGIVLFIVRKGHKEVLKYLLPSTVMVVEIDIEKFTTNIQERILTFQKLIDYKPRSVLNARVSRGIISDDSISLFFKNSKCYASNLINKNQSVHLSKINTLRYYKVKTINSDASEYQADRILIECISTKRNINSNLNISYKHQIYMSTKYSVENILIFPFASDKKREWGLDNFVDLAQYIMMKGIAVSFVIAPQDHLKFKSYLVACCNEMMIKYIIVTPKIIDMALLIEKSNLVICNDSGPAHVAAYFKTPRIAIIGGGHKDRYYPDVLNSNISMNIYKKLDCINCDWNCRYPIVEDKFSCLSMVSKNMVKSKLDNYLLQNAQCNIN